MCRRVAHFTVPIFRMTTTLREAPLEGFRWSRHQTCANLIDSSAQVGKIKIPILPQKERGKDGAPSELVPGIGFRDLVNCALRGAQRNGNVHRIVGVVHVYDN